MQLEVILGKMDMRRRGPLGKTLSTFTFAYGGKGKFRISMPSQVAVDDFAPADMLNHFGVIPPDHKLYDPEIAQRRFANRFNRLDMLSFEDVKNSAYTLCGSGIRTRTLPLPSPGQKRKRPTTNRTGSPKKRRVSFSRTGKTEPPSTPTKAIKKEGLLTPGPSPAMNDIPFFPSEFLFDSNQAIALNEGGQNEDNVSEVNPIVVDTTHACGSKCPVWQKIVNGV
jgi:hypothetical protein